MALSKSKREGLLGDGESTPQREREREFIRNDTA